MSDELRDLDAQVARKVFEQEVYSFINARGELDFYYCYESSSATTVAVVPRFSLYLEACVPMEAKLEKRRLQADYILALSKILGYEWTPPQVPSEWQVFGEPSARHLWLLVTATPEQRCRAALEAVNSNER